MLDVLCFVSSEIVDMNEFLMLSHGARSGQSDPGAAAWLARWLQCSHACRAATHRFERHPYCSLGSELLQHYGHDIRPS